jgi:hypothetical protein
VFPEADDTNVHDESAYAGGSVDVNVGFHDSTLESCLAAVGVRFLVSLSQSGSSQSHPLRKFKLRHYQEGKGLTAPALIA